MNMLDIIREANPDNIQLYNSINFHAYFKLNIKNFNTI